MSLRGLLRSLVYAAMLYSIISVVPAYVSEYCSVAEHAKATHCRAYVALQARAADAQFHIVSRSQPLVDTVNAHPWTQKLAESYKQSFIPDAVAGTKQWVETKARPHAEAALRHASTAAVKTTRHAHGLARVWARRGYAEGSVWANRAHVATCDLAQRAWASASRWTETTAVPAMQRFASLVRLHTIRIAKSTWARVQASQIYQDYVVAQYNKVIKGPELSNDGNGGLDGDSESSTAGTGTPDATPSAGESPSQEAAWTTPATSDQEAEPEEITPSRVEPPQTAEVSSTESAAQSSTQSAKYSEQRGEPATAVNDATKPDIDDPVAAPVPPEAGKASTVGPEQEQETASAPAPPEPIRAETMVPELNTEPLAPGKSGAKQGWSKRVSRTVEGAIASMEQDNVGLTERAIREARPEIMNFLREINAYGDAAVKEGEALARELESRSRKSRKITREDVYPMFENKSREMAEMALKVRARAEQLANDILDSLVSVRKVTLDALDDYFDVVLVEAAKQITDDNDEIEAWKEYSKLKQSMHQHRKRVENHEFNMDEVNVALRESQLASVVLVQDFNKQLIDARARCQLILQEREPSLDRGNAESASDSEYRKASNDDEVHKEEESGYDKAGKATESTYQHAKPAAYVVDEVIELDEEPLKLPIEPELEFEDSDVIETYWETRQVTQTTTI